MDNFHIDVTCEGARTLRLVMDLAFTQHSRVTHYAIRAAEEGEFYDLPDGMEVKFPLSLQIRKRAKPPRLVFMWTDGGRDAVKLPFSLDAEGATDFACRWLAEQDYGREPDHDGDNGKGWRAYCEGWGHVDGEYQGFLAITPEYAMYGK